MLGAENKRCSGWQSDEVVNNIYFRQNVEEQTVLGRGQTFLAQGGVGKKITSSSSSQVFMVQNSKQSRPNYDDLLTPLNPTETSRVPNTSQAENKIPPPRQSEKHKSGSSNQDFRVQNSKQSNRTMMM